MTTWTWFPLRPGPLAEQILSSSSRSILPTAISRHFQIPGRCWGHDRFVGRLGQGKPGALPLNTTISHELLSLPVPGSAKVSAFETDRDFFLRAIDRARLIKFLPWVVSRHNLPDPDAKAKMTSVESELSKQLSQLRVFDKAVPFSVQPEV